jgi:hypothetical protein
VGIYFALIEAALDVRRNNGPNARIPCGDVNIAGCNAARICVSCPRYERCAPLAFVTEKLDSVIDQFLKDKMPPR